MIMDKRLYILMRNDLPSMTTGRAMAQASHAANAFIKRFGKDKSVQAWQRETKQGFGTAIVLAANIDQIKEVLLKSSEFKIKEAVNDPDYVTSVSSEIIPYISTEHRGMFEPIDDAKSYLFHRDVTTCAYIFGSREELSPILGHLKLHP